MTIGKPASLPGFGLKVDIRVLGLGDVSDKDGLVAAAHEVSRRLPPSTSRRRVPTASCGPCLFCAADRTLSSAPTRALSSRELRQAPWPSRGEHEETICSSNEQECYVGVFAMRGILHAQNSSAALLCLVLKVYHSTKQSTPSFSVERVGHLFESIMYY